MGGKSSKKEDNKVEIPSKNFLNLLVLDKRGFEFKYIIGRGGFGKVWKVFSKRFDKFYALKEMSKVKILDKKYKASVLYERDVLAKIDFDFIINMQFSFQNSEYLYIGMNYYSGGDVRYHLSSKKCFKEEISKFIIACLILSLDYIHSNGIIHRDLKPENLIFDNEGYIMLTDFGISKNVNKNNSADTSGTPGYMAPEVMCGLNHTEAVDYYAVGVMLYEFMFGFRPYNGKNRREIKEKLMSKQVRIKESEIPFGWSNEAADFVNKLIQRKPANRLGIMGINELYDHPWFKEFNWKDLYERKLKAPFIPKFNDNFDYKYCNIVEKIGVETSLRYQELLYQEGIDPKFKNFEFQPVYYNNKRETNLKNIVRERVYLHGIKDNKDLKNGNGKITEKNNNIDNNDFKIKCMNNEDNSNLKRNQKLINTLDKRKNQDNEKSKNNNKSIKQFYNIKRKERDNNKSMIYVSGRKDLLNFDENDSNLTLKEFKNINPDENNNFIQSKHQNIQDQNEKKLDIIDNCKDILKEIKKDKNNSRLTELINSSNNEYFLYKSNQNNGNKEIIRDTNLNKRNDNMFNNKQSIQSIQSQSKFIESSENKIDNNSNISKFKPFKKHIKNSSFAISNKSNINSFYENKPIDNSLVISFTKLNKDIKENESNQRSNFMSNLNQIKNNKFTKNNKYTKNTKNTSFDDSLELNSKSISETQSQDNDFSSESYNDNEENCKYNILF